MEEWKRQVTSFTRFRDGNARDLDLSGCAWKGEDFTNCDLRDANLSHCDFKEANFERAELWSVDLSGSDLTSVINLLPEQLAATNLKGAKLPDSLTKFEALEASAKLADNASKAFLVMLGAVAFTFLTLATAKDWQLVTNSGNSKLPVIGVDVAIRDFCWAIPIVLFALFIYFHIYLQRLWEALATLPAVFPDGRRLDERSNPWLVADLMRSHLRWLQSQPVALSELQYVLSMTLGYWVMSITVLALLWKLLFLHNWWITGSQLLMLAVGTGFGFYFLANRWKVFKDKPDKLGGLPHVFHWLSAGRGVYGGVVAGLLGIGFTLVFLDGAHANLVGVDLHGAYLRWADFHNADLQGAHLEDAHIEDANLRGAKLEYAYFTGAHLEDANLTNAYIVSVDLVHADLTRADLTRANLFLADLEHADLTGAFLESAELVAADLTGANLKGANLKSADLVHADLTRADLTGANLRHADLRDTDLQDANLEGAVVSDSNDLKGTKGTYKGKVIVNPKDD